MPELPEVHRATHFLRRYLIQPGSHTLTSVSYYSPPDNKNPATLNNDPKIFDTAKTGTDASIFCNKLQGKKIKDVGRLGKYFWLEMESPPHPLFHFGMTGWVKYKGSKDKGVDYWSGKTEGRKNAQEGTPAGKDAAAEDGDIADSRPQEVPVEEWPPRFTKVLFEATSERGEVTEFAFVDGRRFGKILLINPKEGKGVRETEPLSLNGPDPVLEGDSITSEWLGEQLARRKVPIKAFLLDQHALSGVGNWVADEVLFHAQIHPEKNANELDESQIERLVEKLKGVCRVAALDALGDSHGFPDDWLMRHRWRLDKTGNAGKLPSGEKIVRITVGGRTSAVVPSRQGRGPNSKVAAQATQAEEADESEAEERSSKKRKASMSNAKAGKEDRESGAHEVDGKRPRRSSTRNIQAPTKQKADAGMKENKVSKQGPESSGKRSSKARKGRR